MVIDLTKVSNKRSPLVILGGFLPVHHLRTGGSRLVTERRLGRLSDVLSVFIIPGYPYAHPVHIWAGKEGEGEFFRLVLRS